MAIGDALGATLEFLTKEEVRRKYGRLKEIVGGGWLNLRPGDWTDDTEMTLAVAEGILANPHDPVQYIGEKFLDWFKANPPDVGNTIRSVFIKYQELRDWHKAAEAVHREGARTAGNGALMRTLPLAFAYRDPAELYMMCTYVARMTHWDPEAALTCFIYCLLVREFLSGSNNKLSAWKEATHKYFAFVPNNFSAVAKTLIYEKLSGIEDWPENRLNPSGYTVDTLACALWCFFHGESFEETLVSAVNLGGDADTVGAVTGGLAEVYWGFKDIPERWLVKFSPTQVARLERIAEAFEKVTIL